MKILWLDIAPLWIPLERRLQTFAVLFWISTFLFMGIGGLLLLLYLFFYTSYYYLSLLYLMWFLYDKDTCNKGGRRSHWIRSWSLWKHYANYFPVKLVKTVDLDPKKNYIFGSHPHGILCVGAFSNFATEGTNFSQIFPGITSYLLTLEGQYWFPLYREFFMSSGSVSCSKSSVNYLLSHPEGGNAAVVIVGGPQESLNAHPGDYTLILNPRKGFCKMALKHGASLVPVISFGETDVYNQVKNPKGSLLRKFQEKLQGIIGLAPALFMGRGVFQYNFGIVPYRRPITTVVGKPIDVEKIPEPTREEVGHLHKKYTEELVALFNKYKYEYLTDPENNNMTIL